MKPKRSCFPLLALFLFGVACNTPSALGLAESLRANIVRSVAQLDYDVEVRIENAGAQPRYVERCVAVQRRVGVEWATDPYLSGGCATTPRELVASGGAVTRHIILRRSALSETDIATGVFRFVFLVGASESPTDERVSSIATRSFSL